MATLLIRSADGTLREEPLEGEVIVGRADGNALILTEGGVSRRHARFFEEGGQVMVEDLGSANGTFVDGEAISAPTPLGPRAQVVIGDYELSLKAGAPRRKSGPRPQAPAPANPAEAARGTGQLAAVRPPKATRQLSAVDRAKVKPGGAAPSGAPGAAAGPGPRRAGARPSAQGPLGPSLRGLTGPWANKIYPLRGTVVVGRVVGVGIQLEDESVSRRHAELQRTADGVVVRDLGSANGSTVNGEPLEGEVLLEAGDVVQFGMIELAYEVGDEEALAAPTRRGGGAARGTGARRAGGAAAGGAGALGKKKGLAIGGAALGLLLTAGVVMKFTGDDAPADGPVRPGGGATAAPLDPKRQVEQLLAECRSYAATELGMQPNWAKAREACEKARELDPINKSVIELIQKVEREQECEQQYESGQRMMNLLREEEALEVFAQINKECSYYRVVKPQARDAIDKVKKKSGDDCKTYARMGNWEQALPRCEKYMTFACQKMAPEALNPGTGETIDLVSNCRRKKNCWAPQDPMYKNLLLARLKVDPDAGPWMCPPVAIFDEDLEITDPRKQVQKAFREWYEEKILIEAMELYWDGKGGEAQVKLQRLRADRRKASLHQTADDLRRDIAAVENLYRVGATLLRESEFDKAEGVFKDALQLDTKLMRDAVDKKSFYRSTIEVEVGKETYLGGKHWADRRDTRRACKIWKLGFSFFRGNGDLNRAVGFCSSLAGQALGRVSRCADLEEVRAYAVDGDGVGEKADQKAQELGCKG